MIAAMLGILVVALIVLAFIPSVIAARKGHSPLGYYLFGLVLFVPALIVVLLVPETSDSIAALRKRNSSGY